MVKNSGCTYGKITRTIVENIKEDMGKGFNDVIKRLDLVDAKQIELFNHKSSYYSPTQVNDIKRQRTVNTWLVGIICTLLSITATICFSFITKL